MTTRSVGPVAPWVWAAATLAALVVMFFVSFGVASVGGSWGLGRVSGELGTRLDLALFLVLLGGLGMMAVLLAARAVFGQWPTVTRRDLVLPLAGVGLAVAVELALHAWAEASIGYYDSDFIGWTAGLSFTVLLVAVATFGVQVAPAGAVTPPFVGLGLVAVIACLVVLSNLRGLGDGIGPNSWPLAILVGLSAVYAVLAVIVSWRRLRR